MNSNIKQKTNEIEGGLAGGSNSGSSSLAVGSAWQITPARGEVLRLREENERLFIENEELKRKAYALGSLDDFLRCNPIQVVTLTGPFGSDDRFTVGLGEWEVSTKTLLEAIEAFVKEGK